MKYSFIAQHKKTWPVDVMCRLMGINRHSYYSYHRRHKNLSEDPERQEMLEWIKKVAEASQYTYGVTPQVRHVFGLWLSEIRSLGP